MVDAKSILNEVGDDMGQQGGSSMSQEALDGKINKNIQEREMGKL